MTMSATGMRPGANSTGRAPSFNVGKAKGGYRSGQLQQFTPEQMQVLQQGYDRVGPNSYMSRLAGGDEDIFNEIEAPAMRQFQGLQGNIASRFSGMGSGGARRSSGFQNTMNQASSDFAQDLQSKRQQLRRDAIMDLHGMSNDLLGQRPYENFLMKQEPGGFQTFIEKILGGISGGVGQGIGSSGYNKLFGGGSNNGGSSNGAPSGRVYGGRGGM